MKKLHFASALSSKSFAKAWKFDLISGFQVFLIALPLSLGIAIASGFPPMAGIVAAIIGGTIVSRLSGSHVTINGPAAGLIVVILSGVETLGHGDMALGYKLTLAAIVCAGVLQIAFGVLKVGKLAAPFPVAAVHGMMAAIGMIIIVKQFPVMIGVTSKASSIFGLIMQIPTMLLQANPLIALVGITSLFIIVILRFIDNPATKLIPAPIIVVTLAALVAVLAHIGVNGTYAFAGYTFDLGPKYLVPLPTEVFSKLEFPDFSQVFAKDFIIVTITIALIASLESLLSAAAIDKLDPCRRKTNLNKDLLAVGIGTTLSGLLGGLPMIAEVVRSSANISSGAKTGWSNFFHGIFLLMAILLFPNLISNIPLAALAALLVYTGFRLASPREIKKVKDIGYDQLIIFLTTLIAVLATDILIGIAIGIVVKIVLHLLRQVSPISMVRCIYTVNNKGNGRYTIEVLSPLVFSNLLPLLGTFERIPKDSRVNVDLTAATFIDHTAMDKLHDLQREFSLEGGMLILRETQKHLKYASHNLAARRLRI
ncbi:MAG: SulP family inorganic anion transporter [Oligoflexus sp.]